MKELDVRLSRVAKALMITLDSPMSHEVLHLMEQKDWLAIASLRCDPHSYDDTPTGESLFQRDYQACEFLRKSPLLPIEGINRQKSAVDTFHQCETECASTNYFLELIDTVTTRVGARPYDERVEVPEHPIAFRLASILDRARKICGRVLGDLPNDLNCRFGPGTTFELKGSPYTTVLDKLATVPTATPSCLPIFEWSFYRTLWGRWRTVEVLPLPGPSRGNRFTTVPKDALKFRGICIEPVGNLWVQLGIGGYLKGRLASVGLHVGKSKAPECPIQRNRTRLPFDGQHHHRRMAHDGSVTGEWATIDLSNASDTVARYLVKWVIPPSWYDLLQSSRSPMTKIGQRWHLLHKFSSMGNGFTFELESLIFSSIIAACCDLKVGVDCFAYGDDIIIPAHAAPDALAVLKACGFTPNPRKTFTEGPFRESCGGDFFCGTDVRPCYADSDLATPLDWYVLHNQLRALGYTKAARKCIDAIQKEYRLFGPEHLGDSVLHGQYKSRPARKRDDVRNSIGRQPLRDLGYQIVTTLVAIPDRKSVV